MAVQSYEPQLMSVVEQAPDAERDDLVARLHDRLLRDLDVSALDALSPDEARKHVADAVAQQLAEMNGSLAAVTKDEIVGAVVDEVLGFGPLQPLLDDRDVTEVMVNGPSEIFYERAGQLYVSSARFRDHDHIRRIADRIVAPLGRRLDEMSAMVDARLPDGSRVNIVIPPVAIDSPTITIRKFQIDRFDFQDLIKIGSVTEEVAGFLRAAVVAKVNTVISGGTGTGKTTLLNALSEFIPAQERVVTIEDPTEIRLRQPHVVRLEARPPTGESDRAVTQRELVINSLRMRPDRIIVGEVRGSEAFDMMQAMNTGHEGSLTTVHANSARDALARIENMVLMAGLDLPVRAIREQMAAALHLVVQLARFSDGQRRVTAVSEITGMESQIITMQDLYRFEQEGVDEDGRLVGSLEVTGIVPTFADRFTKSGIPFKWGLPESLHR